MNKTAILTTVFQLFALGFGLGGASFFWTWPLVFAGQLLVTVAVADVVLQAVLPAVWTGFQVVGGGLLIITALMAAPSLTDGKLATLGLPRVLTEALGPIGGRILLVDAAIAVGVGAALVALIPIPTAQWGVRPDARRSLPPHRLR
ncbi:hypothetical protein [Demequina lutea]|uniref:Uncharacterized protein n=1 Tax=Demequina lutea TaxID=431489 RepID=A0A7Y9Z7P5_9MICO|nr:hypothetical protein [Demequina lutea]NYI40372.1 hypothetical protein [Demequina lutea]